jgi:cysteine synthase B
VRKLKELSPSIQSIALQPDIALHGLEGWKHLESVGAPKIYDPTLADDVMMISTEETYQLIRRVAKSDDILLSPSSAANLLGAFKMAQKIKKGMIVTVLPDNAEKYSDLMKNILG